MRPCRQLNAESHSAMCFCRSVEDGVMLRKSLLVGVYACCAAAWLERHQIGCRRKYWSSFLNCPLTLQKVRDLHQVTLDIMVICAHQPQMQSQKINEVVSGAIDRKGSQSTSESISEVHWVSDDLWGRSTLRQTLLSSLIWHSQWRLND